MFLRDLPGTTLTTLREQAEDEGVALQALNSEVRLDLENAGTMTIGEVEVKMSRDSIVALGGHLGIPKPFIQRLDKDLQQHLMSTLLERQAATSTFVYKRDDETKDSTLVEVRDPNIKIIPIRSLLDTAIKVIDPAAPVVEHWQTAEEFRLDVVVPENFERGIGGDKKVGDLSRAGVRIGQNRKQNLAPWVQPFQYRLVCTNGMTTTDDGLKVDARGASVEEVLAEFEAVADRAFKRAEASMEAFYDMRDQRVSNPERRLIRLAEEAGLPTRTILTLAERVPAMADEDGTMSMFDLVNLITNQANDPTIRNRRGARDGLESFGGTIVTDHAERCGHCSSRLN